MKKVVEKKVIVDFICSVGDNFTVTLIDNGYIFEVSGRDAQDNWKTVKLACSNRDELNSCIDECLELDRAE